MAKQTINLGTIPNDGQDGDDARTAFTKVNQNFAEVYSALGGEGGTVSPKLTAIAGMVWAANAVLMATGADSIGTLATGAKGRELMSAATEAVARAALSIGNVDNTSDANKPISTATQTALNAKQNSNAKLTSISGLSMAPNDLLLAASTTAFNVLSTGAGGRALLATAGPEAVRAYIGLWQATLPLTANTSANTLTNVDQTYFVQGATVTDIPLPNTGWVKCQVAGDGLGGSQRTIQSYTPYEVIPATGPRRWERSRSDGGVWTAWYRTDIGALDATIAGKEPTIVAGSNTQFWRGDKSWQDFGGMTRSQALTGLSTATSSAITATDTFIAAMGKLQAQITTSDTNLPVNVRAAPLTGLSTASASTVVATDTLLAGVGKLQAQINTTNTNLTTANTNLQTNVRATPLTGLSTATLARIAATDTVLAAMGKLQAQADTNYGVGQTWQLFADGSGQRVVGTTYTNTTARPITVNFACQVTTAGQFPTIQVAGVAIYGSSAGSGGTVMAVTAIVPPGATYMILNNAGGSVVGPAWMELR
ncbi:MULTISPECIES: hypothetical protein [unclassified Pseudomonas]|uniref:hypothetical protein n=1 Tax=unclassified Pseudomonas TaxID=196821 RepID=UPI0038162F08